MESAGSTPPSVQQCLLVMSGTIAGTNINLGSGQTPCSITVTTGDGQLRPGSPAPRAEVDPAVFRAMTASTATADAHFQGPERPLHTAVTQEVHRSFQAADRRVRRHADDLAAALREDPSAGRALVRPTQDDNLRRIQEQEFRRDETGTATRRPRLSCSQQQPPRRSQVLPISIRDLDHHKLTRAEHREMAYARHPLLNRKCDFCGRNYCSKKSKSSTRLACGLWEEHLEDAPTRRLCDYRRCEDGRAHHTSVCEMMHTRCYRCGTRGHDGGCRPEDERMMSAFRTDFEESAHFGVYTKDRAKDPAWGWYPYPRGVKRDEHNPIISYERLTDYPVFEAMRLMANACALPANREPGEEEAGPSQGRGEPHD